MLSNKMGIGWGRFPPPCIQKVGLKIFLFYKGLGKKLFLFRNVFSSGQTPAINNDRSLRLPPTHQRARETMNYSPVNTQPLDSRKPRMFCESQNRSILTYLIKRIYSISALGDNYSFGGMMFKKNYFYTPYNKSF